MRQHEILMDFVSSYRYLNLIMEHIFIQSFIPPRHSVGKGEKEILAQNRNIIKI